MHLHGGETAQRDLLEEVGHDLGRQHRHHFPGTQQHGILQNDLNIKGGKLIGTSVLLISYKHYIAGLSAQS